MGVHAACNSLLKQQEEKSFDFSSCCDSEAIRTLDPRLRRALLYPAELRNRPYLKLAIRG